MHLNERPTNFIGWRKSSQYCILYDNKENGRHYSPTRVCKIL